MARKRFYPARDGLRVPKPGGGFLRPEGEDVIYEGAVVRFWDALESIGDVVTKTPPHLKKARSKKRAEATPEAVEKATE